MHAFDSTANSASRPSSGIAKTSSSRGGTADENTVAVTAIKRKPSVPRLSLNRAAPTRPTSTRITATVTAHTATYAARPSASIRRTSGGINTTTTTTPARPSPPPTPQPRPQPPLSRPPSRRRPQPLQLKDGNIPPPASLAVASRSPVLSTAQRAMRLTASSSSSTTKPPATAPTARQPSMPALSRQASTRPPLTPKVAGARPPSTVASSSSATTTTTTTPQQQQPPQKPRPQTVTPLARRPTRSDSITGNAADTPKGDVGTPVSTLLQHTNITPRSGPRQHRVDSTSSTPAGTPQPESIEAWDARPSPSLGPTPSADSDAAPPRRPMVSFSSAPCDLAKVAAPPLSAPADSKFFYASSARPQSVVGAPQKLFQAPPQQQKASPFYYANGTSLPPKPNAPSAVAPAPFSPALGPPISTPSDAFSNKFVYANGVPDVLPSPRSGPSGSRPGSSMSATSKVAQGRGVSGAGPPAAPYGSSRPVSPLKQPFHPVPRPSVGTPTLPSKRLTPPAGSLPFTAPAAGQAQGRRISNEYPLHVAGGGSGHKRNKSSATSIDNAPAALARMAPTPRMVPSRPPSLEISSPTGLGFPAGFTGLLQAAEELSEGSEDDEFDEGDDGNDDDGDDDASDASDTSASKSKSPVDELVINARRERKVQDLQITNASLEAINRTLERQLRKQTAELRRYKRLSRAGRLSIASVNSGSASDATMEGPLRDPSTMGLEDLSEEDLSGAGGDEVEPPEEEDEMSDIGEEDGSGSSSLSPTTVAERDSRHRKRDEKRLLMDLSKHQQLLVDSQKINQSIRRCMSWTEELIKEGQRALEYQVRISEVDINGNALREDDEDEDVDDEGETMPAVVVDFGHGEHGFVNGESGKESQDRDSGVELPSDGG